MRGSSFQPRPLEASPLVRHGRALGLELTIYGPALDPARSCAGRLVTLLETLLR